MDFGSHQKKERDSWLTMRFGCCASKLDVDDGREALQGSGMFKLRSCSRHSVFFSHGPVTGLFLFVLLSFLTSRIVVGDPVVLLSCNYDSLVIPLIWLILSPTTNIWHPPPNPSEPHPSSGSRKSLMIVNRGVSDADYRQAATTRLTTPRGTSPLRSSID